MYVKFKNKLNLNRKQNKMISCPPRSGIEREKENELKMEERNFQFHKFSRALFETAAAATVLVEC